MNDVVEGGEDNDVFTGDSGGADTFRGENGADILRADVFRVPAPDLLDGAQAQMLPTIRGDRFL